jgi:hypothetical protein
MPLKNKKTSHDACLLPCNNSWCSIKDDYGTLAELEGVSVANSYTDIDEGEDDKLTPEQVDEVIDGR